MACFASEKTWVELLRCSWQAEGVRRVQESGRRVQLYISGDIIHRGSALFNKTWTATTWAQWWSVSGPAQNNKNGGDGYEWNVTYACHAYTPWQQTVAAVVSRTIAATGCDGVRLDGIGNFHHAPCWNPAHDHAHEFTIHGVECDLGILGAARAAMDALPNGKNVLLSTEGYGDLYNLHALVSWVGWPRGNEISVARVTLPWNIGNIYGPYESVARAAMDGWVQAGGWSQSSSPEISGWNMLRETFAAVFYSGMVTLQDPTAVGDPTIGLRLYDAGEFFLLISAPGAVGVTNDVNVAVDVVNHESKEAFLKPSQGRHTKANHRQATTARLSLTQNVSLSSLSSSILVPPNRQGRSAWNLAQMQLFIHGGLL
eukprot:m.114544 g.114544  ORF g.114544 m.114544 type:complete len:371 (-) comp28360_c2_seq2:976-2088(-)